MVFPALSATASRPSGSFPVPSATSAKSAALTSFIISFICKSSSSWNKSPRLLALYLLMKSVTLTPLLAIFSGV